MAVVRKGYKGAEQPKPGELTIPSQILENKPVIRHVHTHDGDDGSGTVAHSDTTGQTTDDHHDEDHAHDGGDGSGTVAHSDTTGQTANDHHNQAHTRGGADHTGTQDHGSTLSGLADDDHSFYPKGILAYTIFAGAGTTATSETVILSETFTFSGARRYRISFQLHAESSVANDRVGIRVGISLLSAPVIFQDVIGVKAVANIAEQQTGFTLEDGSLTGELTIDLTVRRTGGTGTITVRGDNDRWGYLIIEDMGRS